MPSSGNVTMTETSSGHVEPLLGEHTELEAVRRWGGGLLSCPRLRPESDG